MSRWGGPDFILRLIRRGWAGPRARGARAGSRRLPLAAVAARFALLAADLAAAAGLGHPNSPFNLLNGLLGVRLKSRVRYPHAGQSSSRRAFLIPFIFRPWYHALPLRAQRLLLTSRTTRRLELCDMIKLDFGNVLLKPSHRRQLMAWLRRSLRLGSRLGDFLLHITLHRSGHQYEVRATVHDRSGDFHCRSRQSDWRGAMRELIHSISQHVHAQCLRPLT